MLFNTTGFFAFLAVVLAVHYALPQGWRKYWLLAASYYFYGSWNVHYLWLLGGLTVLDYVAGLWIGRSQGKLRTGLLAGSVAVNLGVLSTFKFGPGLGWDVVLPIGISFHIFQSLSYVIDVYRREQMPVRQPWDYALFLAFFPQLVAGPIVRAKYFFADLWDWKAPDAEQVSRGILLVVLGLVKKMAFADQFAKVSDGYFGNVAGQPGMLEAWTGTLAFGLQIFFDFSGYTDMAIGMAKLLGYHFPLNFRRPYLAGSVTEFWRRWHISLSTWLRDYLYIPLGGNRKGRARTYANLMLTMLLGGLWHGGTANFLLWGGWHGLLLAGERALGWEKPRWWRAPLTGVLVMLGWVLFRAVSLEDAGRVYRQMLSGEWGTPLWNAWQVALAGLALGVALAEEKWEWEDRLVRGGWLGYAVALAGLLLVLEVFGVTDVEIPFVYFQF